MTTTTSRDNVDVIIEQLDGILDDDGLIEYRTVLDGKLSAELHIFGLTKEEAAGLIKETYDYVRNAYITGNEKAKALREARGYYPDVMGSLLKELIGMFSDEESEDEDDDVEGDTGC